MKFKCQYCGRNIDIRKVDKTVSKICEKPLLYEVVATCKRCNHQQRVTVMDTLQKMYGDKYGRICDELKNSGSFFSNPARKAKLMKEKIDLEADIQHRHEVLMEKLEKLQQEGVLMDGK